VRYVLKSRALAAAAIAALAVMPAPRSPASEPDARIGGGVGTSAQVEIPFVPLDSIARAYADPLSSEAAFATLAGVGRTRRALTRSIGSVELYRQASPAVVLIASRGGVGTGTLLDGDGLVLTNWHVIRGVAEAGVVFKPREEGASPSGADMVRATVVRFDEVADLALLKVGAVPPGVLPIPLGDASELQVGADVHAIGHPTGQSWSYTKGIISQLRQGFQWAARGDDKRHVANVVQTQTPINPGNSGGPLLSGEGRLIGVNSFKSGGEGLNFAVAIDEVRRFLAAQGNRIADPVPATAAGAGPQGAAGGPCSERREVYKGRSTDGTADVVGLDLTCDGKADVEIRLPLDTSKPMQALFDRNGDRYPDILVLSPSRDGKWVISFHDNDFDRQWDLVGHHPDQGIVARRYEPYAAWTARQPPRAQVP